MPPSQLKRLKASLREQGLTGPQKSKKQKKEQNKNPDARAQKHSALASIRESFNPFEFKHLSRPKKFEYVSNQQDGKKPLGRPGVTKSQGEETRRKTLLPEMNRKNKVGGILDRRIGENDPTMSMDDRMMARFEREQQRKRGGNVFDLEDADDDVQLTHGGQGLTFDHDIGEEDYDAASVSGGSSDGEDGEDGFLKRKRTTGDVDGEADEGGPVEEQPERKKTKAEVMKEVVAKSKLHKYERQAQKEDDDDLREALDKDLNDVLAALRGHANKKPEPETRKDLPKPEVAMNADRAAILAGSSEKAKDKEYDKRLRQMLQDARAKPTERTKTEEEKAKDEAKRLKELEVKRMKRMKGQPTSADEEEPTNKDDEDDEDFDSENNDAAEFGLGSAPQPSSRPDGVDDEDDFIVEDDLVATDSEADVSEDESDGALELDDTMAMDADDADFLKDVLPDKPKEQAKAVNGVLTLGADATSSRLAFTYACPRSHEELLKVFKNVAPIDIPTVIQRIRALYHSGLHADNKHKLADFACALIDHISYLANQKPPASLAVIESIIRHVHSMSRSYSAQIATHFREHLKRLQISNDPTPGDLALLTAIGTTYPTSDHFHQVVTPAITLMARWMGLTTPVSTKDVATGAYIGSVCLQYQRLSKRYVPELIRYTGLCLRSPHTTPALLTAHTNNILTAADIWSASPAFTEIFTPLLAPLQLTNQKSALQTLNIRLTSARMSRRPQLLHNHRPLPIKSSIPKFESDFDPTKHYDPDKERAEGVRLKKEYKREKKGALRELRKDASFIARESLREKKEKDKAYETKYKRLVAEIQGEEGAEKNQYERERKRRGK